MICAGLCAATYAQAQDSPPPELPEPGIETPPADAMPSRTIASDDSDPVYPIAPILTVDQDVLFAQSAWGRRTQAELDAAGEKLAAENEKLVEQLSDEEAQLTELRRSLDPAEFRKRAEAFDARATKIRRDRALAVEELNNAAEADQNAFYQAALPVMGEMMQRRGAVAVLDRRTLFVSLEAIDITPDLIAELDKRLAEGPGLPVVPAGDAAPDLTDTDADGVED